MYVIVSSVRFYTVISASIKCWDVLSFKEQFPERVVTEKGYYDKNLQQIRSNSRAVELVFQVCYAIGSILQSLSLQMRTSRYIQFNN